MDNSLGIQPQQEEDQPPVAADQREVPLLGAGTNGGQEERALADNDVEEQWRAAMAELADEGEESDEEGVDFVIMGGEGDPSRMLLTKDEREWALRIKAAIEEDPDLDNLSDFAYAQYALLEPKLAPGASLEPVLERAYQMQAFREEHRILNTSSQAKQIFRDTMSLFPGFFLAFMYNKEESSGGGYVFVFDSTKVLASTFSSNPKAIDTWLSTLYYIVHAASPDFESIRRGITFNVECEGFDLMKNFGVKVFSKAWTELGVAYPIHWAKLRHFHTSVFKNLLVSMAKRFIPKEIHGKFEVGCICEAGRLDKIYLVPDETAAYTRLVESVVKSLQQRSDNEKEFSL